ncbi:MAG: NAD-binding protein [Rhizobiales bacterium]|nr:NAD-binding protein [Hyphomicrobiales bacterium]
MAKIAFLGAGAMGQAMIPNLLRGGHSVCVYNRSIDKARLLEANGATVAATIAEAVQGVDALFSMVIDDNASRAVWTGPDGVLDSAASGTLAVESSTVSSNWLRELGGLAAAKGLRFLDCPVAGRPDAAAAAMLVVFAGGKAEDLAAVRPMLEPMSRRIVHFGPVGTGIAFKLIYNVLGAVQVAALAESMNACEAAGIDLHTAADALSDGNTGSPHVKRHSRAMAEGKHDNPIGFTPHGRLKDTLYGCQYQEQIGGQALLGYAAAALFQQMIDIGWGERNDSEAIDGLREESKRRKAKSNT